MNTFAAANGLVIGGTYRVDIFFAHRGTSSVPNLQIQLPKSSLCNALSTGIASVSYPSAGLGVGSFLNAAPKLALFGQATLTNNILRLTSEATASVASAGTVAAPALVSSAS